MLLLHSHKFLNLKFNSVQHAQSCVNASQIIPDIFNVTRYYLCNKGRVFYIHFNAGFASVLVPQNMTRKFKGISNKLRY